ncbi:MAG: hypothetical protein GQ525_02170 [Draconibacterium sp.]|nr:hypothetical protein [Draconibacterium sp.]
MKALIITTFCFFILITSNAQWSNKYNYSKKHYLYTTGDVVIGNYKGGDLGINYIYNNEYSITFGFSATSKESASFPSHFLKSTENEIPANFNIPNENLENFHFMIGRVFNLDSKERVRIILQGGPGISTIKEPIFGDISDGNLYNPNNNIGFQKKKKLSLIINPKIEFPIAYLVGFSIGPMLIHNDEKTFFGIGIGFMYGIINSSAI